MYKRQDLGEPEMQLLQMLREYHDVLLLNPQDHLLDCVPGSIKQTALLGHFEPKSHSRGTKLCTLEQFKARKEHQVQSLAAKLRESRKKTS